MAKTQQDVDNTEMIYRFIKTYSSENGLAPTFREIAEGCYVGTGTVVYHIEKLQALGRLVKQPGKARSIHLLESEAQVDRIVEEDRFFRLKNPNICANALEKNCDSIESSEW